MIGSDSPSVKEAVCRAAGHLCLAEGAGTLPKGSALKPLASVFAALLGPDQPSDVQRQQLHVCYIPNQQDPAAHLTASACWLSKYVLSLGLERLGTHERELRNFFLRFLQAHCHLAIVRPCGIQAGFLCRC